MLFHKIYIVLLCICLESFKFWEKYTPLMFHNVHTQKHTQNLCSNWVFIYSLCKTYVSKEYDKNNLMKMYCVYVCSAIIACKTFVLFCKPKFDIFYI